MNEQNGAEEFPAEKPLPALAGFTKEATRATFRDPRYTIAGKRITEEEALTGLGDPSTWAADFAKVEADFRRPSSEKV